DDYLADRRARGYRLDLHGWLIATFLAGLAARGVTRITVADAVAFAEQPLGTDRRWHARRLQVVRGLAAYVHILDPIAADLIPDGLISAKVTRPIPYLYSDEDIAQLMATAAALSPPLLAAGVHMLIGLIAATGLRSGEAVALNLEDLRLEERMMTVTGKYGKRRLVPLHATTVQALAEYLEV
ncbi:phage integrase family protein, partial [mine drainage metagenome]